MEAGSPCIVFKLRITSISTAKPNTTHLWLSLSLRAGAAAGAAAAETGKGDLSSSCAWLDLAIVAAPGVSSYL